MYQCPTCAIDLVRTDHAGLAAFACPTCLGTAMAWDHVRAHDQPAIVDAAFARFEETSGAATRTCPSCGKGMVSFTAPSGYTPVALDACRACAVVWFDEAELSRLGMVLGVRRAAGASDAGAGFHEGQATESEAAITVLELLSDILEAF